MCVCVGVCVCGCVVCVVWVAHISIVKTKKLRFFRIFCTILDLCTGGITPLTARVKLKIKESASLRHYDTLTIYFLKVK